MGLTTFVYVSVRSVVHVSLANLRLFIRDALGWAALGHALNNSRQENQIQAGSYVFAGWAG